MHVQQGLGLDTDNKTEFTCFCSVTDSVLLCHTLPVSVSSVILLTHQILGRITDCLQTDIQNILLLLITFEDADSHPLRLP